MTASTTLMTFLVQTPPATRTVSLFGSWDNFGKGYPMKRDSRRGADQWTGCHHFENIICDGRTGRISDPRQGALRMGGTYWYYFQLDDDTDHHNPAEPSTTSCPMLPGQEVNILSVPVNFTVRRHTKRNASVSSTDSVYRTMDPQDRYVNPRRAPDPSLSRSNISPRSRSTQSQPSSPFRSSAFSSRSSHSRNISLPASATTPGIYQLSQRTSSERGDKLGGLKAALRQLTSAKAASHESHGDRGRPVHTWKKGKNPANDQPINTGANAKPISAPSSRAVSRSRPPSPTTERETVRTAATVLALRGSPDQAELRREPIPSSSFQSHRRQKSRSREPSPLRSSPAPREQSKTATHPKNETGFRHFALEPLEEVLSPQKEMSLRMRLIEPPIEKPTVTDSLLERLHKQLPNLPNTPSSVCPPIERPEASPGIMVGEGKDSMTALFKLDVSSDHAIGIMPRDHSSNITLATINSSSTLSSSLWSSMYLDGKSPSFSQATSRSSYPASPYEIPQFPHTPKSAKFQRRSTPILDANRMPSIITSSTISSYDTTSPPSPSSETSDSRTNDGPGSTTLQKRYGMLLENHQRYKLPETPSTPGISMKEWKRPGIDATGKDVPETFSDGTNAHEILSDLSYLGDFIQH